MKYKTTKKHPEFKNIVFEYDEYDYYYKYSFTNGHIWTNLLTINSWLEKGWIKEIKSKVWIIDKSDNWKLIKLKEDTLFGNVEKFKSKKAALKYVLEEAKERFKNESKIKWNSGNISAMTLNSNELFVDHKLCAISSINYVIWSDKGGWIAEPIKEKTYPKPHEINSELPTDLCNAMLALDRLLVARNAWWEVDGWEPDWRNGSQIKATIYNSLGKISFSESLFIAFTLSFKTAEIRDEFYKTFRKYIETAIELL